MWVMIYNYPEFEQDVKDTWGDEIKKYGFKVLSPEKAQVDLFNELTKITFLLDVGDRIGFVIENLGTGTRYDEISLYMFFNLDYDRIIAGKEIYPITQDEWNDYIAEDNNRAICQIDLPIIKNEILRNWLSLLEGNFSCENEYLRWKKWRNQPHQKIKSMDELSYNSYKKEMGIE